MKWMHTIFEIIGIAMVVYWLLLGILMVSENEKVRKFWKKFREKVWQRTYLFQWIEHRSFFKRVARKGHDLKEINMISIIFQKLKRYRTNIYRKEYQQYITETRIRLIIAFEEKHGEKYDANMAGENS